MNHRLLVALGVSLALPGCFAKPQGQDSADSGLVATPTSSVTGLGCATDPNTNIRLCEATTACPNTTVDPSVFSGCGFRTLTENFDLECLCNENALCPIGVAASCGDIAALLSGRTAIDICNLVGTGACQQVGPAPAPAAGGATSAGGSSGSCDPDCLSTCSNSPTCIEACGC